MIHFTIIFLCNTLLYLFLLEDKYHFSTTLIASAMIFGLSLLLAQAVSFFAGTSANYELICVLCNCVLLLGASLFLYRNSVTQKLYVAVLCLSNFFYIQYFSDILMGILSVHAAGLFSVVFSSLLYVLFYLLMGLCLYTPLHHFSDRDSSGFMVAITLLQCLPCLLQRGVFNRLFPSASLSGTLLCSTLIYITIVFAMRSLYRAAKFRAETVREQTQQQLVRLQSDRFVEAYTLMREHQRACREQEYILDAINLMVQDEVADQIPGFIRSQRQNRPESVLLKVYHDNPVLNAVLVTHAAFAKENNIFFESNVRTGGKRFPISALCIITNEILTKACQEAKDCTPESRVRYSVSPTEGTLRIEAVFNAHIETHTERSSARSRLKSLKTLSFSDLFKYLFEEASEVPSAVGLDQTKKILAEYSGRMDISNTEDSMMVHISIAN